MLDFDCRYIARKILMFIGIIVGVALAIVIGIPLYKHGHKRHTHKKAARAVRVENAERITNIALEKIRHQSVQTQAKTEADHNIRPVSTQVNKSEYRQSVRKR